MHGTLYKPLPYGSEELDRLDASEKARLERLGGASAFGRYLGSLLSVFRAWKPSGARLHVSELMRARNEAPIEAWESTTIGWKTAEPLLRELAEAMEWPNYHFLPNDPVASVFLPSVNEFAAKEYLCSVRQLIQSSFEDEVLIELISSNSTVEQMLSRILTS